MHIFIISWKDQHENSCFIADKVSQLGYQVTIVYSDPDSKFDLNISCKSIKRSNDLFWEDKFKACLDVVHNEGMLVIHADCRCDDWTYLVKRCNQISLEIEDLGVWAPQIDNTFYNVLISGIFKLNNFKLIISSIIDGIIFYLSPQIISRMRKVSYGSNKFGWGIGGLFCTYSHIIGKLVVLDTAIKVHHPLGKRGYDGDEAQLLREKFLNQFTLRERLQYQLLLSHARYNNAKISAYKNKIKTRDKLKIY